jgi:hypothetical protein
MRGYHAVFLKGFNHSMKNKASTHGGDEKTDDASGRINPHGTNSPKKVLGIGQA